MHLKRSPVPRSRLALPGLLLLTACGGGGGGGGNTPAPVQPRPLLPRSSSPLALSDDDKLLYVCNQDTDSVSVFDVSTDQPQKDCELTVGHEPRSVAVVGKGQKAYVANAVDGTVTVIVNQQVQKTVAVGTEPRALVLSTDDKTLFVANSVSASISVLDVASDTVVATIALPATVGTHPRTLAVNRDSQGVERLYAAMFFGERRAGRTGLDEGQDDQREGRIAVIDAASRQVVATIALQPMADTGFKSNGSVLDLVGTQNGQGGTNATDPANPAAVTFATSAYPNQLAAIAIRPRSDRAYVVSTGASPNGPFGFNVNAQGLVSVFDLVRNEEVTGDASAGVHQKAPLNLNQGLKQDTATTPVLFHTQPLAMAWRPDGSEAWVAVHESDLLVRVTVDANGLPTINAPVAAGGASIARIDLQNPGPGLLPGKAPRGLVINSRGDRGYVSSFVTRSLSVVNLAARSVVGTALSTAVPAAGSPEAIVQQGAELFFTGRGPEDRMSSEAWGGCTVCHPDGHSDGVTWMFDGGPRQTISLDGMFARHNTGNQRVLNWSAVRDENQDFELNTRNVFGGRGLIDEDRTVFLVGGTTSGSDSGALRQYHQLLNTVGDGNALAGNASLPAFLNARRDFGTATLPDGRLVIVGGRSGAGQGTLVSAAEAVVEFDPRSNTLRALSATGFTLRHSLGAAAVQTVDGPRVYAVGGYATTSGASAPTTVVEEFNPLTNTWRTVAPLPGAVAQFGIAANGPLNKGEPIAELNVLCGNTGSENAPVLSGAVLRFATDPVGAGAWRALPFGLTARRNLGAAAVVRGAFPNHVFAIGGRDAAGNALTTVESFVATTSQTTPTDPTAAIATPLTQLPQARHSFGLGTSNNRIYLFGGVDAAGAETATSFEYNPAANPAGGTAGAAGTPAGVWAAKASLPQPARGVGVGNAPVVANFLVNANTGRDPRQDAINEWIKRAVRSLVAPNRSVDVSAGRTLFATPGLTGVAGVSCASCHGGEKWTRSVIDFVAPPSPDLRRGDQEVIGAELRTTLSQPAVLFDVGTFVAFTAGRLNESRFNATDVGQRVNALGGNGFNIPSLLSVASTAPYYHSGAAATLGEVLDGSQDGNGASLLKSVHRVTDPTQRQTLIEFLRSIDETTPTFH